MHFYNNRFKFLPKELFNLINLEELNFSYNKLSFLPKEIGNLPRLKDLILCKNHLTTLPSELINCRLLEKINICNNPIEYIPASITRIINRQKIIQKVYSDGQNVHNHSIQNGIQKSINYILSLKPKLSFEQLREEIILNNILSKESKCIIFEFINDKEVHSILNITFEELLLNVYSIILSNKYKDEIFKILDVEIRDSECKCFTGRLSRLINCLNGFDDNIVIQISENDQIANIIILVKESLLNDYSIEKHKEEVKKELLVRNYSLGIIEEWLNFIE